MSRVNTAFHELTCVMFPKSSQEPGFQMQNDPKYPKLTVYYLHVLPVVMSQSDVGTDGKVGREDLKYINSRKCDASTSN